jgi:hypothetical protein
MNEIEQIIQSVLLNNESKCLDNDEERTHVAKECASKLISASLEQLANLLGGSVECDQDGQVVIYTGHYSEGAHYDNLAATEKVWS